LATLLLSEISSPDIALALLLSKEDALEFLKAKAISSDVKLEFITPIMDFIFIFFASLKS
jgi:hypothetical protein